MSQQTHKAPQRAQKVVYVAPQLRDRGSWWAVEDGLQVGLQRPDLLPLLPLCLPGCDYCRAAFVRYWHVTPATLP